MTFLKLEQNKRLLNPDKLVLIKVVKKTIITCTLSVKKLRKFGISKKRARKIIDMVKDVNIHNHTKTCRKYSTDCRFIFPRYPSQVGDKRAIFSYLDVIETAEFLSSTAVNGNIDWKKNLASAVYHYCLTFCRYGTRVVLQRDVWEIFVNNYNPHWMEAWNANMDLQICLDFFSIITYMTGYVSKPETKTS